MRLQIAGRTACAVAVVVAAAGLLTGAGRQAPAAGQETPGVHTIARTQATVTPGDIYRQCVQAFGTLVGGEPDSIYLAGWVNPAKLNSSLEEFYPEPAEAQFPGHGFSGAPVIDQDGNYWQCEQVLFNFPNGELPPVTATFVSFGVVPVTATAYLTQVGQQPVSGITFNRIGNTSPDSAGGQPGTLVTTADVTLRIGNVKVNGVPLDVGGNCRTTGMLTSPDSPFYDPRNPRLVLAGGGNEPGFPTPEWGGLQWGGAVAGSADIPPFTGCGTNGDLDPLLDASVSGAGNYIKMIVGPLCTSKTYALYCVQGTTGNKTPTALYRPYWNVPRSGGFTATSTTPLVITGHPTVTGRGKPATTITCTDSALTGRVFAMIGPPRADMGTVRWTSFGTCTGTDYLSKPRGSVDSAWTITQQGTASLSATDPQPGAPPGSTWLRIEGLTLVLTENTGPDPSGCTVTFTGSLGALYAAGSHPTLTLQIPGVGDGFFEIPSSGCPDEFSPFTPTTPVSEAAPNYPDVTAGYELNSPISITGFSPAP